MNKKYFINAEEWTEENKNKTGLPRPFSYTFKNKRKKKEVKLATIVPIPWQSKPDFYNGEFLNLNQENEDLIYDNYLCPYCGIKIDNNEITIRWKTIKIKELISKDTLVYSDIHPFHLECMKQGRIFCPFMRQLSDDDFEIGSFIELRKNADEQKEMSQK